MDENDTRTSILMVLISRRKMMTLSEISEEIHVPHQLVRYHLPILEDMGLVIRDGNQYYCQSAFVDEELQDKIAEQVIEVVPKILGQIYFKYRSREDKKTILVNYLQIQMVLTVKRIEDML